MMVDISSFIDNIKYEIASILSIYIAGLEFPSLKQDPSHNLYLQCPLRPLRTRSAWIATLGVFYFQELLKCCHVEDANRATLS